MVNEEKCSWKGFEKSLGSQLEKFILSTILFLLDSESYGGIMKFLTLQSRFHTDILIYYFVREVSQTDSRSLLALRKDKLLKLWKYVETSDPKEYAAWFRICCLVHLDQEPDDHQDFSKYFAWKGFTNDSPTNLLGIGHEWLKELLFFYVRVGNHSSATDEVFNDEFLNRLCVRAVGEFKNLEAEYYSVTVVRDKIDTGTLETFCFFVEVIGFGIGAGSHTEGYGLFMPAKTMNYHQRAIETRNKAYHENYVAVIQQFSEWVLFLYTINPEQFLGAIKTYKFHHELVPFLKYYYEGEGKAVLEERYWYKGIKALRSTAQ
jgi:hypothetical protein